MKNRESSGPASTAVDGTAPASKLDPASEIDYWHVNYESRPYYREGRSFGDYEAAYRYGAENASALSEMSFEQAEEERLATGWAEARGASPLSWSDVRDAVRDAWTRVRRDRSTEPA
ncbi:MAG: hypothetical protein KBB14_06090 [Thermoanaerobaculia bacterium]|nr:hypothetical protein [Thermoanaerobaculia bacterium]